MTRFRLFVVLAAYFIGCAPCLGSDFLLRLRAYYERAYLDIDTFLFDEETWTSTSGQPMRKDYHLVRAAKDGRYYQETYHFGNDSLISSQAADADDPIRNTLIFRDGVSYLWNMTSGIIEIDAYRPKPLLTVAVNDISSAAGLASPEERMFLDEIPASAPYHRKSPMLSPYDYFLPYALRDETWSESGSEETDGHKCLVLTRTLSTDITDTIWCEQDEPFIIRRRLIRSGKTAFTDIRNSEFEIHSNGLAWPRLARVERNFEPRLTEFRLKEARFENIPDTLFDYQFPEGAYVWNRVSDERFVLPAGESYLEDAVTRATEYISSGQVRPLSTRAQRSNFVRYNLVPFVPAIALVLMMLFTAAKKWQASAIDNKRSPEEANIPASV